MKEVRRIKINGTPNRIGLIYAVLKEIAAYGINIITMESDPYICCKIEWDNHMSEEDFSKYMKSKIPEITYISYIDLMEYEKNQAELTTLLNNIDDYILNLNPDGCIVNYNEKSEFLIKNIKKGNKHINDIIPKNLLNVKTISQKCNVEFSINIGSKEKWFLADINPIKNESGILTSYCVIIKKMDNIRKLINTITRPSMVTFEDIIGNSKEIKNSINLAKSVAPTNSSILIRGESGTGKELFARAIHMDSKRASSPFVCVNCASIPETLLESEFFGYERGAFTGANTSGKQGYFELANGGTLFLDEIGDLSTHLQAKILRALQEKKIRRIGGTHEIDIDVRIISATHRDLEQMIEDKTFREDLYYRLNVIPVYIPPLRDRTGDVELLIDYFIKNISKKLDKPYIKIEQNAMDALMSYSWPGNVRELNNIIERAISIADKVITLDDLMMNNKVIINSDVERNKKNDEFPLNLPEIVEEIEKRYIMKAFKKFGSYRKVADNLNISHTSVMNKIREYNNKM